MSTVQVISLQVALHAIREYDGTNITLSDFIDGVKEAQSMLQKLSERVLVKVVKIKLKIEAKRAVKDKDFKTATKLEAFLKSYFSPH